MEIVEELMIVAGISLNIFAVMECQGSLVAKIEKKYLALMCLILMAGQALALGTGTSISALLYHYRRTGDDAFLEKVLAAGILLCLGIRFLLKAWRNERIIERRKEEFDMQEFLHLCIRNFMFSLLVGIVFGFMGGRIMQILLITVIMTAGVTILGMYTGYRLGFEHKVKAYLCGGVLLIMAGVDVIARYIEF